MDEEQNFWWRKLGFYTNPFTIKPAVFDNKVFGQDSTLEDLDYKIPSGTISFVEGSLGTGKTTVLKHLISKYRGKGKVIYFACNRIDTELNIEELLKGKYGFWGKLFGMMPKEMMVLLDEAQELSAVNTERIKYFFDQGNIKSVVFTGVDYEKANFHESIKERIGTDGLYKVKELTEDEVVSLIRNRIGNSQIVSDDLIKKVWTVAKKNPRRLLQKMDKVYRYAVENMESEVKEEKLDDIFNKENSSSTPKEEENKEEGTATPPAEEAGDTASSEKPKKTPKKKTSKKKAKKTEKKKEEPSEEEPKEE